MRKTFTYVLNACLVLKGRVYFPLNCELWLYDVFTAKSTSQVRRGLVRGFFYTIASWRNKSDQGTFRALRQELLWLVNNDQDAFSSRNVKAYRYDTPLNDTRFVWRGGF